MWAVGLIIGWMAWRLSQQMSRTKDETAPPGRDDARASSEDDVS